jgi:hypothetical protein
VWCKKVEVEESTPHAARGNNAQARDILQIVDITEQWAKEHKKQAAAIEHLQINT